MVRPKWAARAETVPSRTGSSPIEPAAGTKNSMIATAGAIPVPETKARHQGATIADDHGEVGPGRDAPDHDADQPAQPDALGERRGRHDQRDDVVIGVSRPLEERRRQRAGSTRGWSAPPRRCRSAWPPGSAAALRSRASGERLPMRGSPNRIASGRIGTIALTRLTRNAGSAGPSDGRSSTAFGSRPPAAQARQQPERGQRRRAGHEVEPRPIDGRAVAVEMRQLGQLPHLDGAGIEQLAPHRRAQEQNGAGLRRRRPPARSNGIRIGPSTAAVPAWLTIVVLIR